MSSTHTNHASPSHPVANPDAATMDEEALERNRLNPPARRWLSRRRVFLSAAAFLAVTTALLWAAGALVQSALPTGALVFVLAQQYGIYLQRSTAVIMASTVVSLFTLSALFVWLGIG